MAFKHGEDYVVYDFETTGLVDKDTKILEIGATKYNKDGEVIGRFNRYLDHGLEGDKNTTHGWQVGSSAEQAAGTHKIKYDTIKKHGGDPKAVIEEFSKFVGGAQMGGHNSNDFDKEILKINAGSDYERLFGSSSHFDTLEGSLKYRRRGDKLNKVETLVKVMDYNVGFGVDDVEKETQRGGIYNYVKQNISEIGAHSAAWDVKATGGILKTINKVDSYATGKSKLEDIIGDKHTRNFLFDQNTIVKREDGSQINVMNELIDNVKDKNNVNSRRAFVE